MLCVGARAPPGGAAGGAAAAVLLCTAIATPRPWHRRHAHARRLLERRRWPWRRRRVCAGCLLPSVARCLAASPGRVAWDPPRRQPSSALDLPLCQRLCRGPFCCRLRPGECVGVARTLRRRIRPAIVSTALIDLGLQHKLRRMPRGTTAAAKRTKT